MLLLLGMLEMGFAFDHELTLQYATREGARVGAALANGGACGSPEADAVDPTIIAAVNRVLKSPGSRVKVNDVPQIRIYKATASGAETQRVRRRLVVFGRPGAARRRRPSRLRALVDRLVRLHPVERSPPDSIGVSLVYTYRFVTPLGGVMRFFGGQRCRHARDLRQDRHGPEPHAN